MKAIDLRINTTYQYKCSDEPIKVVYIGKNMKSNNTYTFKGRITNHLSEKSVENYITQLEQ